MKGSGQIQGVYILAIYFSPGERGTKKWRKGKNSQKIPLSWDEKWLFCRKVVAGRIWLTFDSGGEAFISFQNIPRTIIFQDDEGSLTRFKEIAEAYEVLSNPEEKRTYDERYGFNKT